MEEFNHKEKIMKILTGTFIVLLITISLFSCSSFTDVNEKPPNIILILADDLGYGELGCYGQKLIETPNIDKLARTGIRFTQHYSGAPVCAPARCVLLTGMHSGHAYVRGNDEWGSRGNVWNYHSMIADSTLEGQRPMLDSTITIAKLLKEAGYKTGMIGKWGLGAPHTNSIPNKMGFDYFLGYNCQRQAHTYFPVHLYENEKRIYLENDTIAPNTKLHKLADPYNDSSYSDFYLEDYAPDIMFEGMMNFIDENKDSPFFMYWATPIPHVPIQAPKKWVDHYIEKFGEEEPYLGDHGYFPHPNPNAGYAAMISYMDEKVGQLISRLKEDGIYENTLIIFTSDNGPTYAGGVDPDFFNSAGPFNNGYGWTKGFLNEGGIRVPMIVSWPEKIRKGSVTEHISAFYDFMPTFCDIASVSQPANTDGISFLPLLENKGAQKEHEYLYWEFPAYGGQQAVRTGEWKGIRKDIKKNGNLKLELYNLNEDLKEENNVAGENPQVVQKIIQIMNESRTVPKVERFKMKALGDE